jgi:phenylacetate-coenzyme A ligase PaaK-like adenylate-forming protein
MFAFVNNGVELIESETGTPLALTQGSEGALVYIHLRKEAQPLVRYRARNVVRILGTGPCACGRRSFHLSYQVTAFQYRFAQACCCSVLICQVSCSLARL